MVPQSAAFVPLQYGYFHFKTSFFFLKRHFSTIFVSLIESTIQHLIT